MQQKLKWQAYTGHDRNRIIQEIKDIISNSDGYIINSSIFSDFAINLNIEIEPSGILSLHRELSEIINVSDFNHENVNLNSRKEWLIFLHISFSSGKGELKSNIPAVPG